MFWLWKSKCFSKVIFLPWIHRCIEGKLWKYDIAHRYAQREGFPHQSSSTQKLIYIYIIEVTLVLECSWRILNSKSYERCWTIHGSHVGTMFLALWVLETSKQCSTGPPQLASYNAKQIHETTTAPEVHPENIWMHWLIVGPPKTWRMFHQSFVGWVVWTIVVSKLFVFANILSWCSWMSLIGLLLKFLRSFAACHKETREKYIRKVYGNCNDTTRIWVACNPRFFYTSTLPVPESFGAASLMGEVSSFQLGSVRSGSPCVILGLQTIHKL